MIAEERTLLIVIRSMEDEVATMLEERTELGRHLSSKGTWGSKGLRNLLRAGMGSPSRARFN